MAVTWSVATTGTTANITHTYTKGSPNDTYTNTRFFGKFDLSGYSGSSVSLEGTNADGLITRRETVLAGSPPSMDS